MVKIFPRATFATSASWVAITSARSIASALNFSSTVSCFAGEISKLSARMLLAPALRTLSSTVPVVDQFLNRMVASWVAVYDAKSGVADVLDVGGAGEANR